MSNLELVALVVRDYGAAIHFFVDVLQFELVEDTLSMTNDGRPKRWVVVRPSGGHPFGLHWVARRPSALGGHRSSSTACLRPTRTEARRRRSGSRRRSPAPRGRRVRDSTSRLRS